MNNAWRSLPHSPGRRALLVGAAAAPWWAGRAFAQADPEVAAYKAFVGARAVRTERLVLDIPRIADNGNLVPVRIALPGPFAPGAEVKSIHLFSQKNPVAQMAVFHFPVPVGRVEVESTALVRGSGVDDSCNWSTAMRGGVRVASTPTWSAGSARTKD